MMTSLDTNGLSVNPIYTSIGVNDIKRRFYELAVLSLIAEMNSLFYRIRFIEVKFLFPFWWVGFDTERQYKMKLFGLIASSSLNVKTY